MNSPDDLTSYVYDHGKLSTPTAAGTTSYSYDPNGGLSSLVVTHLEISGDVRDASSCLHEIERPTTELGWVASRHVVPPCSAA